MLAAGERPNIVYILADDLGQGDLAAFNGDSQVAMPHADRLAREGMRFTDMHSPSSVCTPTRYGIMTGRYCWRSTLKNGVLNGRSPALIEKGRMTVPSFLKAQGYYTAGVGKWHLGLGSGKQTDYTKPFAPSPLNYGFDYYFGIPASLDMEPYLFFENDKTVEQPTARTPGANSPRGYFWREGQIAPGFKIEQCLPTLADKAVDFIRGRKNQRNQPFFLYVPLTGPHTPWAPTPEFKGKSRAGLYGDFVMQTDAVLGQILKALEETGQSRNTLVMFTSDNGAHWTPEDKTKFAHRPNGNLKGQKADIADGGHRIPFLARWPGKIKPNSVSHELHCLTDLLATVAEITGGTLPFNAGEDSFSLLPALMGKRGTRQAIVHHSVDGMFAIRQREWKLCLGRGSGGFSEPRKIVPKPGEPAGELYDLLHDPGETKNLYAQESKRVLELTELLDRYKRDGRSRP